MNKCKILVCLLMHYTKVFLILIINLGVRSLVVSNLRLETKGSGSSPAASYAQRLAPRSNRLANA